jgi:hypothetical protein
MPVVNEKGDAMLGARLSVSSLCAVALAAILLPPVAAASPAADPCEGFLRAIDAGLLEPYADDATREHRAALLLDAAQSDCAMASHVAAGLSALGDDHPARLLPRDLDAAERGFLRLLEQGNLAMLTRLSYLASAQENWELAMGWAQLAGRIATMVESRAGRKSEAEATRLLELFAERPDSGEAEAKAALATLMEAHGESIRKGLAAYDDLRREGTERMWGDLIPDRRNHAILRSMPPVEPKAAQVMFLVGVDPDGRIARKWWFDAIPDAKLAKPLGSVIGQLRFNRNDDVALRWAIQPMSFANGEFGLGPGGDRLVQNSAGQDAGPF